MQPCVPYLGHSCFTRNNNNNQHSAAFHTRFSCAVLLKFGEESLNPQSPAHSYLKLTECEHSQLLSSIPMKHVLSVFR